MSTLLRTVLRRPLALGIVALVLAGSTVVAYAYWTTHGTGTASASVGTLNAPTNVQATTTAGSSTVGVSWTASGAGGSTPTGYYVTRIKNSDNSTAAACGTGAGQTITSTSCSDTSVADGSYRYTVTAIYRSWTAASSASNDVVVSGDATPPVVSLTKVNGASVTFPFTSNTTVTSVGGACGTVSGDVASVSWSVSGGSTQSGSASCSGGAWTATLSTALSADATYSVSATQADAAGNIGNSGSKSVAIDKTAPVVSLTTVNGSGVTFPFTSNTTVTSVGGACGTVSGDVASVSWSVSGGSTQSGSASCSGGAWTATLSTALSADATYSVSATQADAAGNIGNSGSKSVAIDKTAPTISTLVSANGAGKTAGKLDSTDNLTFTFSEQMKASSFCSAWTDGTTVTQSDNTANVNISNTGGINVLTISSWSGCPTFNLGSVDLGSPPSYVTSPGSSNKPVDFSGSTIAYNGTTHTLVITFGTLVASGSLQTVSSSVLTFSPAGIADLAGNLASQTKATSNAQQF